MNSSTSKTNGTGCFVLVGIILLGVFIHGLVRYFSDKPLYEEAHTAFLQGDCDTAEPVYNEIIQKVHIFDFGKIKANTKVESKYCEEFIFATNFSLMSLYDFTIEHPENPLIEYVDDEAVKLLGSIGETEEYVTVLNNDACINEIELVKAGLLVEENALLLYKLNCAKFQLWYGEPYSAFEFLEEILEEYPQHSVAKQLNESFKNDTVFCSLTQQISESSVFNIDINNLANIFLDCAENYTKQNEFGLAAKIYDSFLINFPEHPDVESVNLLLPDLLIKAARDSGSGTIERPNESGWAPEGISRVVIQNDSPHDLRIVFSGPDARIEILPACETCMDYYAVGPIYCPEQGPIGTFDLTPGEFEVLVETTNEENVVPFTGTWSFQGGKAFYTCFFIVTTTVY